MTNHSAAIAIAAMAASVTALLTGAVRIYARRSGMLDHPNERSSHRVPTPRGGGLAMAAVIYLGAFLIYGAGELSPRILGALLGGGIPVTLAGWLDDRRSLSLAWRASVYLAAAALALFLLEGGSAGAGVAGPRDWLQMGGLLLAMAWLVNLYNFMDGTDGIAAVEALSVAGAGVVIFIMVGDGGLAWLCLIIASAAAGFLYWNLPPARIFMGDSGSCSLGFLFAVIAVAGMSRGVPLSAWIILLAVFVFDATFTLARRLAMGEDWYHAHRTHAYQILVQSGVSHLQLAMGVFVINTVVLAPLAVYVTRHPSFALPAVLATAAGCLAVWITVQRRRPG